MTLPPSNAQPSRSLLRRPQIILPPHSMPPSMPPSASLPVTPPPPLPATPSSSMSAEAQAVVSEKIAHEHAIDFATHSWDLATGGLKTLTAKRELPTRFDRRATEIAPDPAMPSHNYTFMLIIMVCIVLILIGGGVVLYVIMLQP